MKRNRIFLVILMGVFMAFGLVLISCSICEEGGECIKVEGVEYGIINCDSDRCIVTEEAYYYYGSGKCDCDNWL
jgi:hypothetical protein